jgi:hypothetical protein
MLGIDPSFACHKLNVNVKHVSQKRHHQSPEKAQAASEIVEGLLHAKFISEISYTQWISNVVLVKNVIGKWRMCVDYMDLNKSFPKDAYPFPNIDKLVDSSSGYKLLSFMDV